MGWEPWARLGLGIAGYALTGSPIGFVAGSYLGSVIFPTDYETEMPTVGEYQMQSSAIGIPIPIVLGTTKIPGNIVWMGDLDSYEIKHSAGGGKGGGGEQEQTEIKYRRSFIIAICEGPATVLRMWQDKKLKYADSTFDFTDYGSKYEPGGFFGKFIAKVLASPPSPVTFFDGDGNSGISTLISESYAEYSNVCLAYFEDYELGNAQRIPNFLFEVSSAVPYLQDYYKIGDDSSDDCWWIYWLGQTFTANKNYIITSVKLKMRRELFPGNAVISIQRIIGSIPSGDNIAVKVFNANELPEIMEWVEINFDVGALLSSGAQYIILMNVPDGNNNNFISWAYDSTGEYPGGNRLDSNNDGDTWQPGLAADWMFETRGTGILEGKGWIKPTSYLDPANTWDDEPLAYDGNNSTFAVDKDVPPGAWTNWLELHLSTSLLCSKIKFNVNKFSAYGGSYCNVDLYYEGAWHNVYADRLHENYVDYTVTLPTKKVVSKARIKLYNSYGVESKDCRVCEFSFYYISVPDMNFASMIKDLLINEKCGNYEESDLITADFDSIITYCDDNDLRGSLAITQQKPMPDWIAYICSHFQGYFYEIGGKVGLNCYRDQASVLSIEQDDLVRDGDEPPVHITKRAYSSTFNRLEATWTNRSNDYKTSVVPAFDRIDQREAGQVRTKTLDLKAICNKELAAKMAWRIFIDQIYRFSQYAFKIGYKSMLLEVGDVIDVTDGYKLVAKKMRVMSVSEEKDGRRALISAIEDISGLYPTLEYSIQESETEGDSIIDLTDGTIAFRENYIDNRLFLSITPGGAQCNGFYIYRSYDDESYDLVGKAAIGEVTGGEANSTGTIQSNLPAYTTIVHRKNEAFDVSIGTITDLDTAIADNDFFNNRKIARIGTEIIGYKTCVESATAGIWRVSNLIRGLFGTYPVAHVPGEVFNTLNVDFVYTLRLDDIGKTIYFKVVNFYADEIQLISEVSAYSHVVSGKYMKPLPVSLMRINGREGLSTYKTVDVILDWYFCSKTSGFGRGGYGNALWGAYEKDPLLERLKVELEEEGGTPIVDGNYELTDYGEPVQLEILEADRNSKNPVRVKITPGSHLWSDSTRDILIEKI